MKVVALVPIKLNNQRLPNKNILDLGGKPMCYYMTENLLNVEGIDEAYVYCSDESIINYMPEKMKLLKRDTYLDGNLVKGQEIYERFINEVDADIYVLAHATAPFIKKETIQNALNKVLSGEYDSALSVKKVQTFTWYKGKTLNYDLKDIPRTQDIEPIYYETSAFFIFKKEVFTKMGKRRIGNKPYFQEIDDIEAVDIDYLEDFKFAQAIIKSRNCEEEEIKIWKKK